jgi:hypothetical protein
MTGIVALVVASDPRPDDNNVVAGWVGFVVLMGLIVAVVFIFRSFTKQLKKVEKANEEGVYGGDQPAEADSTPPPTTVDHDG